MLDSLEVYKQPILRKLAKWSFTGKERSRFYRKLASQVDNGVRLSDAIKTLHARVVKRDETETMAIILADIQITLERGEGLSKALNSWTDPLECMGLAAGEKSGKLGDALRQAADSLGSKRKMIFAVIKGGFYPTLLSIVVTVFLYFVGVWFVPQISSVVDPDQFHGFAAVDIWLSGFVQSPGFWILLFIQNGIVITILALLPKAFGQDRFRVKLDRIPPWSIYRLIVGADFLVALGSLLRAGVKLDVAIQNCKEYANPYLTVRLNQLIQKILDGENFGNALEATQYEFPSQDIIDDLMTYSTLPNFDKILTEYGKETMNDAVETVEIQAVIMNITMFLTTAVIIGVVFIGIIQLQLQLATSLQEIN